MSRTRFHVICGSNVQISADGSTAQMMKGGHGVEIAFTATPLVPNVKVCLRVTVPAGVTCSSLIFGFTNDNPVTLVNEERRLAWRPYLAQKKFENNRILHICTYSPGEVLFGYNNEYASDYFSGVDISRLWFFVHLPCVGSVVQFVKPRVSPRLLRGTMKNLRPLTFHRNSGPLIKSSSCNTTKWLNGTWTKLSDGYVISASPIKVNQMVCFHTDSDVNMAAKLGIGFTSLDPDENVDLWPEERVWSKIKYLNISRHNDFKYFYVNSEGDVYFGTDGKKNQHLNSEVDTTFPIWALIVIKTDGFRIKATNAASVCLQYCYSQLKDNSTIIYTRPTTKIRHLLQPRTTSHITPSISQPGSSIAPSAPQPSSNEALSVSQSTSQVTPITVQSANSVVLSTEQPSTQIAPSILECISQEAPSTLQPESSIVTSTPQSTGQVAPIASQRTSYVAPSTLQPASSIAPPVPQQISQVAPTASQRTSLVAPSILQPESSIIPSTPQSITQVAPSVSQCQVAPSTLQLVSSITPSALQPTSQIVPIASQRTSLVAPSTVQPANSIAPSAGQPTSQIAPSALQPTSRRTPSVSRATGSIVLTRETLLQFLRLIQEPGSLSLTEDIQPTSTHQNSTNNVNNVEMITTSQSQPSTDSCVICYENPTDTVFVSCGHMCSCYECALNLWRGQGNGKCPICRGDIERVLRVFKN